MQDIKISVVIPVYNVEKYIKECIESVINQTFKDIEIIVVDDGSKDSSMKIVEKYLYDKRIKIIKQKNGGAASARNTGMKEAKGKYIYFIDSDDFIENNVLEELYKNSELETMDIVFTSFSYYKNKLKKTKKSKFKFPFKNYINKGYYYLYNGEEINVWNRLYKKEFLLKYNFKFIEGIIHEDQDFGFKTTLLADKVKYTENYGYKYRIEREGSVMSSSTREKNVKAVRELKKEINKFFQKTELNEFQKIRVYFKLLGLEFWEKSLLNMNDYTDEIKKLEIELEKIYKENSFNLIEREVLKKDIRNLIKNKKINILKIFYWKNGIINFKIFKTNIKEFLKTEDRRQKTLNDNILNSINKYKNKKIEEIYIIKVA